MKKLSKKVITVSIILLLIVLLCIATIIIVVHNNKKAERDYNNLMKSVASDIYKHEAIAEYHSAYITSTWYNAIFKKRDTYTDKYAFPEDEYGYGVTMWVDFQTAISNYLSDNKQALEELKDFEKEIASKLNTLQNVPNESYRNSLEIVTSMYSNFSSLVSLANNPTGTYREYGEKCNKYKENFESDYKKLLLLIPDIANN